MLMCVFECFKESIDDTRAYFVIEPIVSHDLNELFQVFPLCLLLNSNEWPRTQRTTFMTTNSLNRSLR